MIEVSTAEMRGNLSDVINRVRYGGERVAVKRRAQTIAVIISPEEAALLERLVEEAEQKIDLAEARRARAAGGRPIPLRALASKLGVRLPRRRGDEREASAKTPRRKRR